MIEGVDGAGTTTQAKKLAEKFDGFYTFQPTDGLIGEKIDEMIEKPFFSAEATALAFVADRMAHMEEVLIPKLKDGETVFLDRYYYSTLVYQSVFGADFEWLKSIHEYVIRPDKVVVIDCSLEEVVERITSRDGEMGSNIFEKKKYLKKVINRYRSLEDLLDEDIFYIEGDGGIEEVFSNILEVL